MTWETVIGFAHPLSPRQGGEATTERRAAP